MFAVSLEDATWGPTQVPIPAAAPDIEFGAHDFGTFIDAADFAFPEVSTARTLLTTLRIYLFRSRPTPAPAPVLARTQ